jgi:hypothetical protein
LAASLLFFQVLADLARLGNEGGCRGTHANMSIAKPKIGTPILRDGLNGLSIDLR